MIRHGCGTATHTQWAFARLTQAADERSSVLPAYLNECVSVPACLSTHLSMPYWFVSSAMRFNSTTPLSTSAVASSC